MSQTPGVLVVDDEESIRFSLRKFLTDAGFDVTVASHPIDAKGILSAREFDVAVIDRILPDGQSGLNLIKYIKSVQPFCQTILISAYPSFKSAAESLRCKTFAYLTKPLKREEVCGVVDEAARQSTLRREREAEAKTMERHLLQASKMEVAGQLVSGIAHDFNNMLQVIAGNVQLLMTNKQEGHPDYLRLNQIETIYQEAKQLIRQLLDSSNGQELSPEITDINSILQKIGYLLRSTIPKNIEVDMRLSNDLSPVEVDPYQIEQCLLNLGINARDAILEKGTTGKDKGKGEKPRIIMGTEDVILDEEHCRLYPWLGPGKYILITVSDTGIGMAGDVRERIFDPFFTTKAKDKGTGLGLYMAHRIIKNHQGVIGVYSESGKGTTFSIYLPTAHDRKGVQ